MSSTKSKNYLVKRKRNPNTWHMKDPGLRGRGPSADQLSAEDIDMEALNNTVAFSDWYEAVLATSPAAKRRG